MPGLQPSLTVELPELAQLRLPVAGLGTRAAAASVDLLVLTMLLSAVVLGGVVLQTGDYLPGEILWPAMAGAAGLLPVVAPFVWELAFAGSSLGKRLFSLRVVGVDASAPTVGQLALRNLFRLVDLLPGTYAVGVICAFVSPRGQRLGDLVAGTVVIHDDPRAYAASAEDAFIVPAAMRDLPEWLVAALRCLAERREAETPESLAVRRDIYAHLRRARPRAVAQSDEELWAAVRRELGAGG